MLNNKSLAELKQFCADNLIGVPGDKRKRQSYLDAITHHKVEPQPDPLSHTGIVLDQPFQGGLSSKTDCQ